MSELAARLRALGAALRGAEDYWRPPVFHNQNPPWRARRPDLAEAALALDDARLDTLLSDNRALADWAGAHAPEWQACFDMARLPEPDLPACQPDTGIASWHIPGRKQAQIEAFAEAAGAQVAPVLEWCSGKGHLGRHYARRWGARVLSLDHDATLCAAGRELAAQAGVTQSFVVADALAPGSADHLAGRHALALHACGDLHRMLLRGAAGRATAVDLSPCCYYRMRAPAYQAFNAEADLALSRDELHLPVTETLVAGARERRLRDAAMARKLGYLAWYADHVGAARRPGLKPVPSAWNNLEYVEYCKRMATRDGLATSSDVDWPAYLEIGHAKRREVMRLNLIRMAFRRPLEVWLALDQALFLERSGFHAKIGTFCAPTLTPRNILISARR